VLRVAALYPDLMSIYADRGNLLMLERRCSWRGIGFELSRVGLGDGLDGAGADLLYIGGGQDRDQRLVALDLAERKREAVHESVARGATLLAVCGGYQLLGRSYELGAETLPGLELVDLRTVRSDGPRLIGNVAIEVELEGEGRRVLAGFENHGGRTWLGASERPLGRDGFEGVLHGGILGTYLHGPLLPKNAWLADWLIARSLGVPRGELEPLDDSLEEAAHAEARAAAGV